MRWRARAASALAGGVVLALVGSTLAAASFAANGAATSSVSTKRIFPTSLTVTAWDLQDASAGGAPASRTDAWAAVDGRLFTTSALGTSFSASRYVDLFLGDALAPSVPVTGMTLNVTMAASGGGTACVYAEVRRASNDAVLGSLGSTASPLACSSSTTQATTGAGLGFVTSSDTATDLKVRIFLRSSTGKNIAFDRATVTGAIYDSPFTLLETSVVNSSSGVPATSPWPLAASDGTTYAPASSWTTAINLGRYLRVAFPASIPTDAVVSVVTLRHSYAGSTATAVSCAYLELYSGSTLLATRGSTTTPYSCTTGTAQATDVIQLPEVDTAVEVDNLVVRLYMRNSASSATRHDLVELTVGYSLT